MSANFDNANDEMGISMVDVLKEEEELQRDADAVLGPVDDGMCTYQNGYLARQPLYACLTCCKPGGPVESAGICLGCSLACHEDHNLIELYTKRNFKCDCGNSKFPDNKCKLLKDKTPKNELNTYNQNFTGVYCICARPYPDPDASNDEEMIQCCVCEDWYHASHLDATSIPDDDSYSEMICKPCTQRLHFLTGYVGYSVTAGTTDNKESEEEVNVTEAKSTDISDDAKTSTSKPQLNDSLEEGDCRLKKTDGKTNHTEGPLFFPAKWRKALCRCIDCKVIYDKLEVSFLMNEDDTVVAYEASGKRKGIDTVSQELDLLSTVDRVTRTEMVHAYTSLSTNLRDYLRKFAENGKVVRDDDIHEFFSQLKANKKNKTDYNFQYSCK